MTYIVEKAKNAKSQMFLITSNVSNSSNIGNVKGIGIKAQRKYLYSIIRKYKNIKKIPENVVIKIYGVKLNKIENKDVMEEEVPIATIKSGNTLLIRNFILQRLKIKNEHPKTVNAKKKEKSPILGNKLKVLKVNQEKFTIRIHERK